MLRGFLVFCSLFVALLAVLIYRLTPSCPSDMENYSMGLKIGLGMFGGVIKMFMKAENYGLVADSATSFRVNTGDDVVRVDESKHPDVNVERTTIAGVPVVIFRSPKIVKEASKSAAVVYTHGGAFIVGNPDGHFLWTKKIALDTDAAVISVDYRLAPEHPFPIPIEDSLKVTKAVFDEADKLRVDPTRIMIAGDSAGGNLAAVIAIQLSGSEKYPLRGQLLLSPLLQALNVVTLPSYKNYASLLPLPTEWFVLKYAGLPFTDEIQAAIRSGRHLKPSDKSILDKYLNIDNVDDDIKRYFPTAVSDKNVETAVDGKLSESVEKVLAKYRELVLTERAWPLLTSDEKLRKMSPAFISIAEYDPFSIEDLLYVDRLRKLGAKVSFIFMKGGIHASPAVPIVLNLQLSERVEKEYIPAIMTFIKQSLAPKIVVEQKLH